MIKHYHESGNQTVNGKQFVSFKTTGLPHYLELLWIF